MALTLQRFLTPSVAAGVVFALVSSLLFYRARKNYLRVPLLPRVPPGRTPPDCMVVIPARNEAGVVAGAVKSFSPDTVIVVDDHSTDKTADEARDAGAGVLEAPPLQGALGKTNACMAGARILTSRWILFADADTRYQEGFLESAVEGAYHSEVFFLSVHHPAVPEPDRTPTRAVYRSLALQQLPPPAGSSVPVRGPVRSGAPGSVRVHRRPLGDIEIPG